MAEMGNDNGIDYIESDERVEIDPRDVRKINEPICLIKLTNGNYKQPTKREIKLLEKMGISNPCLGKSKSSGKPQTTKKVAASKAKGASSNVTKKVAPAVATSKPAVPTSKPAAPKVNVSDLTKELENIELEQQKLEAERIAAEEARIAAAAEEERATLESNKKLEEIRASMVKATEENNEEAERAAKAAEEEAKRAAAEAEAVRVAAEAEAVRVAEVQRAKTKEVNKKFQMFVKNVMSKVKEEAAAAVVLAAAERAAKEAAEKAAAVLAEAEADAERAAAAAEAARVKAAQDLADQKAAEAARVAREEAARLQAEQDAAQAAELAAAEAAKVAAQEQAEAQAQKEALQKLQEQAEAAQAAAQAQVEAAAAEAKLRADPTQRIGIGEWAKKNQIEENTWKQRFQILQDNPKYGSNIRVIPNTKQKVNNYLSTIVKIFFEEKDRIISKYKTNILDRLLEEPITSIANDNDNKIGTNFEVSYNSKVRQVTYDKDSKTFSFTEPPPDGSKSDFTVDNIKAMFSPNSQGGKKHKNTKAKNTKQKNKKTLKKGVSNYNKKRYTMRKKKITRNKIKSRSRKTKTKKQKRGVKRPRYTKRR